MTIPVTLVFITYFFNDKLVFTFDPDLSKRVGELDRFHLFSQSFQKLSEIEMKRWPVSLCLFLFFFYSPVSALAGTNTVDFAPDDNGFVDILRSTNPADRTLVEFPVHYLYSACEFGPVGNIGNFKKAVMGADIWTESKGWASEALLKIGYTNKGGAERKGWNDAVLNSSVPATRAAWVDGDGLASGTLPGRVVNIFLGRIKTLFTADSPHVTPLPVSSEALLFGSGLVGLIGISRKF